ncbi:MAG: alpha-ketoglutarate-dependent dioxygenase AlkB [Myxococcota bacterium]
MKDTPPLLVESDFIADPATLFESLRDTVDWDTTMSARLTASFGVPYNYAQMVYPAKPMHAALVPVVAQLEARLGIRFNNCLLNYYLDERSKMGFHSDETRDLVPNSGVAIVSVGAPRKITFRRRDDKEVRHAVLLEPGSLLFMELAVQDDWVHAIKRQRGGPRISLTWRAFRDGSAPMAPR